MESVDGRSSSTTPPVCTMEGWEKGRRIVHKVAEQHDEAGVERRRPIPVKFARNLRLKGGPKRPLIRIRNCPFASADRFLTALISQGANGNRAPAQRMHRLSGGGLHVALARRNIRWLTASERWPPAVQPDPTATHAANAAWIASIRSMHIWQNSLRLD